MKSGNVDTKYRIKTSRKINKNIRIMLEILEDNYEYVKNYFKDNKELSDFIDRLEDCI